MNAEWLQELLPPGATTPSKRQMIWWLLFFALFPLAYIGGVTLQLGEERSARIPNAVDRAKSIRLAEEFASSQGVSVAGWNRYAISQTNDNLLAYYGEGNEPVLAAARSVAPAQEVQVLFRSRDNKHEFRVYLSLTGRVIGYDAEKSSGKKRFSSNLGTIQVHTKNRGSNADNGTDKGAAKPLSDTDAEAIARHALASNATLNNLVKLGTPKVSVDGDDPTRSNVAWDASPAGRKELTLHITESVRGSQVVAQRIEAGVSRENVQPKPKLPILLNSIYGLFLTVGTIYAIYRYAKRTLQKEVSHLRTLVVAALFCVSYSVSIYSLAVDQVAVRVSGEDFAKIAWVSYITSAIAFSVMGLLVGIGYGSGEGEVREAYPGKLTSLDALLAGRVFSKDVASSILFGAASAGWLLLLHNALSYFLRGDTVAFRNDVLAYTFARLPWLTLLLGKQYDALLIAVAGLLLPASFLLRQGVRRKRRFAWLIVFALLSVLRDAAKYPSVSSAILATLVFASALLLPFLAFDLLAAMVSLSALTYANELARLSAVIPSWTGFSLALAASAAASLAVAGYLAVRGRRVREEDVRPQYAKYLAERMSMQAEILAAREAQLRLLPQAPPEMRGVQIAACCLPARGLGGDFYDFFPLDADRMGIFVAQGGEQGLASALRIALAKGVLMHASTEAQSPTQIALELEASIAELLEGDDQESISFAYAVMDRRRNVLSYARVGTSPRLLIYREGAPMPGSAQLERVITVANRPTNAPGVSEGSVFVQAGDRAIFVTNGVTLLRSRHFGRREEQWLDLLVRDLGNGDQSLQESLVTTLSRYQNQALHDLTAVVFRVMSTEALAQQVVA